MTAQFAPSVATGATPFDLPPIASASQLNQQVLPFSQLLQQAQAPTPTPTNAAPPSPPPVAPTSNSSPTKTADGTANATQDSSDSSPSQPIPPSDEAASAADGPVAAENTPAGVNANTQAASGLHQPDKVSSQTVANGPQQKSSVKKGTDAAGKQGGDGAASASVPTAAATVVAPKPVSSNSDRGKSSKGPADDNSTKDHANGQSDGGPPTPVTPDVSAQLVAGAVTTAVGNAHPKATSNGKDGAGVNAVEGAKQIAAAAAAQAAGQTGTAHPGSQRSASAGAPGDTPTVTGRTPPPAKNGLLATTAADETSRFSNTQPTVSQSDSLTAATTSDADAAAAVQAVATVAASEPQVVSTITVDQATATAAATSNAADTAPTSTTNASPNNAPPATPAAFAASMSQGTPQGASSTSSLNTVDRARFVQRVARAFQMAGDQGGQMRLRLSPPELGSLQMQISVKQGALTAHIQTDNTTAQQALLDSLPDLRDRLAQQDIRIDRFDVELTGQSSGGMPQSPQGNPDSDQAGRRPIAASNPSATAPTIENDSSSRPAPLLASGALNVVV